MGPEFIAALVREANSLHAEHGNWDFISYDGLDRKVNVRCSCGVPLTITVPRTEQPAKSRTREQAPKPEAEQPTGGKRET